MTEAFQFSSLLFPTAYNRSMNVVMLYLLNNSIAIEFVYITNFIELMTVYCL